MKQILLIEDDAAISEIERDFLEISGFGVTIAEDGIRGTERALEGGYDLILLDLMLPGRSGYDVCKAIRAKTDVPILMVTALIEDTDKVRGLGLGADDYIAKPFSPTELVARVKANIAQYERLKGISDNARELNFGDLRINARARRAYVNGAEVELKNKEYELLYFLASNAEIVFSKEHIYERIWGMDAYGDTKTVAVHIGRLREKIEKNPENPKHIQTVWGAGYRFKA
ncbi:MAG: response regulator transcription factor [Oscillospiraceae bacterium]|jgi:DNA-binding response OmpR family regulator|nr:response regulator transcription factor [Oscillospiraceae bacterium]